MKTLYPAQQSHVDRLIKILKRSNSAVDLSVCGLGKMVCGAEIAMRLNRPLVVVAPLSTLPAWKMELAERNIKPLAVVNYDKLRGGRTPWVKKDKGIWSWHLPEDALIIFDEAQRTKSTTSITGKIAIAAKPFTTLMLSGSLAESPLHMRAAGYLLDLHQLRNFWTWARARGCVPCMFGGLEFEGGFDVLDKLHKEIVPEHGSQMSLAEMAKFLPENQIIFEPVDFGDTGAIQKLYEELEAELLALAENAENDSKGAEILTAQLRARQQAELLKVPLLTERATDLSNEGAKVIVFLNFSDPLAALSERLGGIPLISGKHGDRQATIERFQRDEIPILGVNVAAGGVGISLHGKAPRQTLLSPSFNPIDIIQALGRAPRVGGGHTTQHILSASGTIEESVCKILRQKLEHIDVINNGDPARLELDRKMKEIERLSRESID